MTLFGIAWRNIRQRLLTSGLTALSLALGVALVVSTLVTGGIVRQAFESGSGLGYNMIVGAKGSPLQLVLNSVYFISKPIENIPWAAYQEFLPAAARADGRDGRYAASTRTAVPICMGDYFRGFRVVGTNAAFFDRLARGDGRPFEFSSGGNFRDDDFFGGVVGATVAANLGLKVGDPFAPTHGADDGKVHDPFTVRGILERTGTPVDRGVFVNMEGFYLQDGHAKPTEEGAIQEAAEPMRPRDDHGGRPSRLPESQREVTAVLLETASLPGLPAELTAMGLRTAINEGRDAQAALPIAEIRQLLDLFVRPLQLLLLLVTAMVVVVSAIGILVSMVGSSLERSRDVAVMRALGARRSHVLATVLIEAVLLAVGGGLAGWVLGHLLVAAIGPLITSHAGVSAGLLSCSPLAEALLVPLLVGLAIVAALLPAIAAYRTDVAKWLQGPG
ncbi:MAG: ABC transporter permease [Planctomycetia bacterium]|nr:ABC transporter permease [Planctomycetia bacterium]